MIDGTTFDTFIQAQGKTLRAKDQPPSTLKDWQTRRAKLRQAMFDAMGPMPEKPCELSPKIVGTLKRKGYRIEKLLFQSRPDVWVTGSVYVPEDVKGKRPAVLVVHGHWAMARRDPVVQARCLGLVKLGFVVLAIDAFSAGERHPEVKKGSYHGALLGSTLWPAGYTLLGLQVYDNRRAVDYLLTRPEVDGKKLGITGASGGGNQSMYAGALDERFAAVVPVCSVGTYQAYLKAACCVCEVLPGALTFTEEGDVLGLVAPRALLVINATKDSFQFSVGEAKKSLERAKAIYKLHEKSDKVHHATFESPHAYNQAMRETMYGWMSQWLDGKGTGKPIAEPKHEIESADDLACYPMGKRPARFLFPATFAAREARQLLTWAGDKKLDHKEAWQARSLVQKTALEKVLGERPKGGKVVMKLDKTETTKGIRANRWLLTPETGLTIPVVQRDKPILGKVPFCVVLHLDGKDEALKHPVVAELLERNQVIYAPDLRATGEGKPKSDGIRTAPDHNSAEHSLWIGRPLLGQWLVDVSALVDWLATQPGLNNKQLSIVGIGQAALVALVAGAMLSKVTSVTALDLPVSLMVPQAFPTGTRMGLLAPGLLKAGDVPHLAALIAPRRLQIVGGVGGDGKKLATKALTTALGFTTKAYEMLKAGKSLSIHATRDAKDIAAGV